MVAGGVCEPSGLAKGARGNFLKAWLGWVGRWNLQKVPMRDVFLKIEMWTSVSAARKEPIQMF